MSQVEDLMDVQLIQDMQAPTDFDAYRDEIQFLLTLMREQEALNVHDLLSVAEIQTQLLQVYAHLVQDHFAGKFHPLDLSDSDWQPYDPSLDDEEPFEKALSRMTQSHQLVRFLSKKLDKAAERLQKSTDNLVSKTAPLFAELGIAESDYTASYEQDLKQQALDTLNRIETDLNHFKAQFNANGFSIQSNQGNAKLQKSLDKLYQQTETVREMVENAHKYNKNKITQAKNALIRQAQIDLLEQYMSS